MALDSTRLGNDIADKVIGTMVTPPGGGDEATFRALCVLLATAIVDEIDQHLEATGTTTVGSGSSAGTWPVEIPEGGAD